MLWGRKRREEDLERELQAHLELEAEECEDGHATPEEARYAARRALGNTTLIKEATRETWGFMWLDRLSQDLRYGCRALKKNPGFAAVAVLTAALGIGANTSIFSIVHAVLLRPLPYRNADRLVSPVNTGKDTYMGSVVADFQYGAWRDQAGVFDGIAAHVSQQFTITGNGEAEQLRAQAVTPGLLRILGTAPVLGRDFTPGDAAPRGGRVALVSHGLWMRRFGGDPSVLSKEIILNGTPYSIAGVLPRHFEFPENNDVSLLIALPEPPAHPDGVVYFYNVIARMKEGITAERAQADLALINRRLESAYPKRLRGPLAGMTTRVIGLHERLVGDVRPALLALSGAVALVLLIVCVNLCNLLLARAVARQKEIAVRIALGAGRVRILRQLLTEAMLLASAGGLAGLALAFGGIKLLRAIAPAGVPHIEEAHISAAVLGFNFAVAVLCGILFGLAPVRAASGIDPEAALKRSARFPGGGRQQRRLENLLIISETAFALILVVGAGLLVRTLAGLTGIAPGFRPDNVITARLSVPFWKYPTAARERTVLDGLVEKVRSGPGVESASTVACLPYGGMVLTGTVAIEGRPAPERQRSDPADNAAVNYASGGYFKTMGIPILQGRGILDSDTAARPPVAVVNDTFSRRFFPDAGAVGKRIRVSGVTEWLEIVGVSGTVRQGAPASRPRAEVYQSAAQAVSGGSAQTLVVRSAADPRAFVPWLRSRIAEVDKDLPAPEIQTMRAIMASPIASQVFVMRLLSLFAGIALALAALGIYSVLVYSVERRSHEIGIRIALGARRAQIMRLILGRGLRLSLAGAAIGIAGGLGLTRYLKSLLYGVTPYDPATLAGGCALLVSVALAAAYLPARRAMNQDAMTTLRAE